MRSFVGQMGQMGWIPLAILAPICFLSLEATSERNNRQVLRLSPHGRKLQTFLLNKNTGPDFDLDDNDAFFGGGGGKGSRSGATAICRSIEYAADNVTPLEQLENSTIHYDYEVETAGDSDLSKTGFVQTRIPKAVDFANVGSLWAKLCDGWNCLIRIEKHEDDRYKTDANCVGALGTPGGSCFPYSGDVQVWYVTDGEDGCTKEQIDQLVRDTLYDTSTTPPTGGMTEDAYIDEANAWVEEFSKASPDTPGEARRSGAENDDGTITAVRMVDSGPPVAGIAGVPEGLTTDESISPAAWAVLGLVVLLLLLLCCLVRRCLRKDNFDDLRSVGWSTGSVGDKTYQTADMRNLAGHHSKLDVHKCKSATCEVCRPSLGKLNMVQVGNACLPVSTEVGGDTSLPVAAGDAAQRRSPVPTIAEEDDDEDMEDYDTTRADTYGGTRADTYGGTRADTYGGTRADTYGGTRADTFAADTATYDDGYDSTRADLHSTGPQTAEETLPTQPADEEAPADEGDDKNALLL